jgi:hypothetical protein
MPTLVAFSADGDYIIVDEPLADVAQRLTEGGPWIRLTLLPKAQQRFAPSPAWVNAARVAYIREPANQPS